MSRRTRISRDIRHRRLGTNHHSIYSSTSTNFPECYSIFGSPVSMPAKILPLIQDNKINYVSRPEQLIYNQSPLINLSYQEISHAKSVNLTIAGKLIQKQNQIITKFMFILSLFLCCLLSVFYTAWFRRRFYSKYKTTLEQYRKLCGFLNELQNCQTLILNIQDNQLNEQKIELIEKALLNSIGSENKIQTQSQIIKKPLKKITIRNFCYFMTQIDVKKSFKNLAQNERIQFIFVWQKKVLKSDKVKLGEIDSDSVLNSISRL